MTPELTHDRKRVRCTTTEPLRCHRILAWRFRHRSGRHYLMTYRDWRGPRNGPSTRKWQRRESGHSGTHHDKPLSAMAWDPAAWVLVTSPGPYICGCGATFRLDGPDLDAAVGGEAIAMRLA